MKTQQAASRTALLHRTLVYLFGELAPASLREIEGALELVRLPGGARLFSEGDPGNALYVVMAGRLRAVAGKADGGGRTLGEIPRGESVGELALITGEPRAATVEAIRDSLLIRFSKVSFERLIRSQPELLLNLSRLVVRRLSRADGVRGSNARIRCVAVVFAGEAVPQEPFLNRFSDALGAHGPVLRLSRERVEALAGIDPCECSPEQERYLEAWLDEREAGHRFLVYEGDASATSWTRRCLRQADRVVVVASAAGDPVPRGVEAELLAPGAMFAGVSRDLVLLHSPRDRTPSETRQWLDPRRRTRHHHVRWGQGGDMDRLARFLAGKAVGVVLSGGGAKALAHIGILKALREASIPVDLVGGTSMGAILAAGVAADWDFESYLRNYRQAFARGNPMGRVSLLPLVSLCSGARMDRLLADRFGGADIEDLWIPFYCASSNLTTGSIAVHDRGALWKALRASASLPGVFPPVVYGNHLHVDGGTLDNLPVATAREIGAGVVIACDLDLDKQYHLGFRTFPSNWELFKDRYITGGKRFRVPDLPSVVFQATLLGSHDRHRKALAEADISFRPKVRKIGFLEWGAFGRAVETGYLHATERLAEAGRGWLEPNGAAPGPG
jgi:NTE family protein